MPFNFKIEPEFNLVILKHIGTISDDEFLSYYKSLFNNDSFDPSMNLIIDLENTDSSTRSSEVLYQLAGIFRHKFSQTKTYPKIAIIAPKDLSFGLARTYEAFIDKVPVKFNVFREKEKAYAWLEIPDNTLIEADKSS